jgi:hypothetical protein
MSHPVRPCPHCGQTLEWAERRTDDDADHDYYHPCPRGCGVFCYSQSNGWTRFG